tara:strand:- start:40 stop:756 length:717 start_codon:yes stop_codon:yes gene_type:complete
MEDRFFLENEKVLPDKIFLNDEFAVQQLEAADIPVDLAIIVGNPILEEKEISVGDAINHQVADKYDDLLGEGSIVYISEELASAFPTDSVDYPGFDEYRVLNDILELAPTGKRVVVKLHPEERQDKYDEIHSANKKNELIVVKDCNTEKLLETADFVVGMGSMLLIEAAKTRRDVVSYRPNQLMPFIGNQLGVTKLVTSREELKSVVHGEFFIENSLVGHRFDGSMSKILEEFSFFVK